MNETFTVPWQDPDQWREVGLFFRYTGQGAKFEPVRTAAAEIHSLLDRVAAPMDALCSRACRNCTDICCRRATIWYDFTDLVYYWFRFDRLPEAQIYKTRTGNATCCGFLTSRGCAIPRARRPYVCTWYLCPAIKDALDRHGDPVSIVRHIDRIQRLRKGMAADFCRLSSE